MGLIDSITPVIGKASKGYEHIAQIDEDSHTYWVLGGYLNINLSQTEPLVTVSFKVLAEDNRVTISNFTLGALERN
jgi:hypothetical protein